MNQILFPTDWSKASLITFEYAYDYALTKGSSIVILNAYQTNLKEQAKVEAFELACKKRDAFLENFKQKKGISKLDIILDDVKIIEGDTSNTIVKATEPMSIELVIIGTDGEKETQNGLSGNIPSFVIQNAHCPVLAIPPSVNNFPPRKILCAVDFKNDERNAIGAVMSFADLLKAEATFVYISSNNKTEEEELAFRNHYKSTQYYLSNLENWRIDIVSGENVIDKLHEYIKKHNFEVLALETRSHKQTDYSNYKSITKEMLLQTTIPIFVLHSI